LNIRNGLIKSNSRSYGPVKYASIVDQVLSKALFDYTGEIKSSSDCITVNGKQPAVIVMASPATAAPVLYLLN
jgi:hypothetical protein